MSDAGRIEIRLHDTQQLFNALDPSPLLEKDLARDVEEFILSWAREQPRHAVLRLKVHVEMEPGGADAREQVAAAVRRYFGYRADFTRRELRDLLREGHLTLGIGLLCLAASVFGGELAAQRLGSPLGTALRESLLIGGWVAMWRPLQTYLYDWLPLVRRARVQARLATAEVEIARRG